MLPGKALLLFALVAHAPRSHEFMLPSSAVITVGERYHLDSEHAQDKEMCLSYQVTPVKVRRMFSTYHRVTPGEMHDYYSFAGCGIGGTVKVGGSTFEWKSEPLNTMQTTYPDGRWKLLGGAYSADPSTGD